MMELRALSLLSAESRAERCVRSDSLGRVDGGVGFATCNQYTHVPLPLKERRLTLSLAESRLPNRRMHIQRPLFLRRRAAHPPMNRLLLSIISFPLRPKYTRRSLPKRPRNTLPPLRRTPHPKIKPHITIHLLLLIFLLPLQPPLKRPPPLKRAPHRRPHLAPPRRTWRPLRRLRTSRTIRTLRTFRTPLHHMPPLLIRRNRIPINILLLLLLLFMVPLPRMLPPRNLPQQPRPTARQIHHLFLTFGGANATLTCASRCVSEERLFIYI